ncbi:MAG TPA: hypothetical protein VIM33_12895 [Gaiellaceae bacterium]|jgi:hypothetical protein
MGDAEEVLQMVIAQAQARLASQFRLSDSLDVKALGVLAADAAALGVLIAAHDAINPHWWIAALILSVGGVLLLIAVWPRELDEGPNLREFYRNFGGGTAEYVGRQLLSELLAAIEGNNRKKGKSGLFKLGFAIMVIGLIGCAIVGLDRH